MNELDFQNNLIKEVFDPCIQRFEESLPQIEKVYHYTSQEAFQKILEGKEIWMSNALAMNDPGELRFGIDIVENIIKERASAPTVLDWIREEKRNFSNYRESFWSTEPYFLFSVSEKRNDVNQWMHYGDKGKGVALEFIWPHFRVQFKKQLEEVQYYSIFFMPVQYFHNTMCPADPKSASPFVRMIEDLFTKTESLIDTYNIEIAQNYSRSVFRAVVLFGAMVKQSLFAEEKEYRIAVSTGPGDEKIRIVVSDGTAQMKYPISIDTPNLTTIMNRVYIGPKNYNNPTNQHALSILAKKHLGGKQLVILPAQGELK